MNSGRHIDNYKSKLKQEFTPPVDFKNSKSKIMYIEDKSEGLEGDARIGRVYYSKSGKTIYYKGLKLQSLKGSGSKANYFEIESGDHYWLSGPRKDQQDRLYVGNSGVEIDKDVLDEYLIHIGT